MLCRFACLFSTLLLTLSVTGCLQVPTAPGSSVASVESPCAEIERQVGVLEQLVAEREKPQATQATAAANPNASGKSACEQKSNASWDDSIGVCRCNQDPELRNANAWSINNTMSCPDSSQKQACDGVSGSKWNLAIGRCECVNDATKFQANAFSIRNHLKCEGDTTAQGDSADQKPAATDLEEPAFFWGFEECSAAQGNSDYAGKCTCADGRALISQFDSCAMLALTDPSKPSDVLATDSKPSTTASTATATNDFDGMLDSYRQQLEQRKKDLAACKATTANATQSDATAAKPDATAAAGKPSTTDAGKPNAAATVQPAAVSSRGNCLCAYYMGKTILYTYDANVANRSGTGKGDNVALAWTDNGMFEDDCTKMAQKTAGFSYNSKYDVKSLCNNKAHPIFDVPNSD